MSVLTIIRKLVRILLPKAVRVPLGNLFYRKVQLVKNGVYPYIIWYKNTAINIRESDIYSGKVTMYDLIRYCFSRIINHVKRRLSGLFQRMWIDASRHRYLISIDHRSLSVRDKLQKTYLEAFLALPDLYYRNIFRRLEPKLVALKSSIQQEQQPRSGIVFMIGGLGPGGSERQITRTITCLTERGYSMPIKLICLHLRNQTEKFYLNSLQQAGVTVALLNRDHSGYMQNQYADIFAAVSSLPLYLRDMADYLRTLCEYRPTIVHFWLDEVNIKAGMIAVALGIPRIILSLRSLPPCNFVFHHGYMREAYRWLAMQKGVTFINNSKAGALAYEKWLGLPVNSICVIHNGFDFDNVKSSNYKTLSDELIRGLGISPELPVLGTVIRFTEEKRPLLWLEIAAEVKKQLPTIQFLVAGDGPLMEEMKARVDAEDLRGSVHLVGHVSEAYIYMAAMDLFLLTSRAEGLPNVLVEAQALGIPVVTMNVGGAPETVQHGVTGWVLESDKVNAAACQIVKLINDADWLASAADQAQVFVRDNFGIGRMINETIAVYENKTGGPCGPGTEI